MLSRTKAAPKPWELAVVRPDDDSVLVEFMPHQVALEKPQVFAQIRPNNLFASDLNGGIRIIFEVDRFGRLYITLRDEFDRLIKCITKQPGSSDGSLWIAEDKVLNPEHDLPTRECPADRIYVGNFFVTTPNVSVFGSELLPGAIAATSFDAGPCESYDLDLPSRQRRGATMEWKESDVTETIERHRQHWQEVGGQNVLQRVLAPLRENKKEVSLVGTEFQDGGIVASLAKHLPQDIHHFRALLNQLARELKAGSGDLR